MLEKTIRAKDKYGDYFPIGESNNTSETLFLMNFL